MLHWLYRLSDRVRQHARARVWEPHLALGRTAEDMAHRFLQRQGLIVIERNWRTPNGSGEVDLIARDGEMLVFAEVKARTGTEFSLPERAVGEDKMARLRRAALRYIDKSGHDPALVRFDTLSVVPGNAEPVTHVRDAFAPW